MKARILLIDDELQWLKSFKNLLEQDGYDVITATNVTDAIQVVYIVPRSQGRSYRFEAT